jgi:hypothetical protein
MNYLNKYVSASFLIIAALLFSASSRPALAQSVPPLGAAESFAALAGTTLTATGAGTVISGNVGVSPGLAVTGFPPAVVVNGQIYTGAGSLAGPAQDSALIAYNNLKGQTCPAANNLTGKILGQTQLSVSPGVYCFDTSVQLNAILTLNDGGDPNAIFIFQIGTTLTTASSSQVIMSSGGRGKNVFWQVGSSATIGTSTTFRGHIIANTSITLTTSASTTGRIFALNGAATIDTVVLDAVPTAIQFSASSYTVGEEVPQLIVQVTRTGDTTGAATVKYATSDTAGLQSCSVVNGKASERCDYETTIGTLRFAAGEASKTFNILMINDVYVEGPETFTLALSAPTGASLGAPSTATVTILDNDFVAAANPIDGVDFFVTQQYLDFLARVPDTVGFANWVATLSPCPNGGFGELANPGCDRVHVSAGFYQSAEFQDRGYFAYRFYEVGLGRKPLYREFIPDMADVGGAQSPAEEALSKATYVDEFVLRPEFVTKYSGLSGQPLANAVWLTAGLPGSPISAGSMTNGQILRAVVETSAASNKFFNRGFVSMQYFGYLRRDPDTIGFTNWVATLDADSSNFRHMIFGFIYSDEYRHRFGP